MERAAQIGVANQDNSGQGLAAHLIAERQAQRLKHGLGQQVGLIEDHDWHTALGAEQVGVCCLEAGPTEGWFVAEAECRSR